MTPLPPTIAWVAIVILALLSIASIIIRIWTDRQGLPHTHELRQRIRAWWAIVAIMGIAVILGNMAMLCLFAFISFLALREFFSLLPQQQGNRKLLFWAYLAIPFQYYWVSIAWYGMFITFIPVYLFLLMPIQKVISGDSKDFLLSVSVIQWG